VLHEDRAQRRPRGRNDGEPADVDAFAREPVAYRRAGIVVAHRADEVGLHAESREGDRRRRGRPAAGGRDLGREHAPVGLGQLGHLEDGVERRQADAHDMAHRRSPPDKPGRPLLETRLT
jgi:hypothetical protein